MSFVDATAIHIGIPHPIVQRATRKLLALLRKHAPDTDMRTLIAALPDLAEYDDGIVPQSRFARLFEGMRRLATSRRATRVSLRHTGLGNDDVAFASAFATHLREHLGEAITSRLVASVPGLPAMSSRPLVPHIAGQTTSDVPAGQAKPGSDGHPALSESADQARPEPPTMS